MSHKLFIQKTRKTGIVLPILVSIATIALSLITPAKVGAAIPGSNGKLAYGYLSFDPSAVGVKTSNLDGTTESTISSTAFGGSGAISGAPRFSADGQMITFTEKDADNPLTSNIIVANADGSNRQNITNINPEDFPDRDSYKAVFSSFSPDGTKVVYGERWEENDSRTRIVLANSDGTSKQELISPSNMSTAMYPVFSPDGSKIAYLYRDGGTQALSIYVMNSDGTNTMQLVHLADSVENVPDPAEFMIPFGDPSVTSFDWSPDGQKLVYVQYDDAGDTRVYRLNTVDLEGNIQTVYERSFSGNQGGAILSPQFTPEGRVLFKAVQLDSNNFVGSGGLYTINADGSNLLPIENTVTEITDEPSFYMSFYNYILPTIQPTSNSGNPTSLTSAENGTPITLSQSGCSTVSSSSVSKESSNGVQDAGYSYPLGLVGFNLTGCDSGGTATITLTFTGTYNPSDITVRKYNTTTNAYTTLTQSNSNLQLSTTTLNNNQALQVQYQITDGGLLDQDNTVNGSIQDPVGIATTATNSPNTGISHWLLNPKS